MHQYHPSIIFFFLFLFLLYLSLHTIEARRNPIKPSIPEEIKNHLHRFGYLPNHHHNNNKTEKSDLFSKALSRYQKNLGLPITGKPDSATLSQIRLPRCGFPDKTTTFHLHTEQKYVYFPGRPRWTKDSQTQIPLKLTYAFSHENTTPHLTIIDIRRVFQRAFRKWASVIPVTFTETEDYVTADVKIGFFTGDHGDGEPFDGVLGVLAHTFSPENGRLHLDGAETWAVDFNTEKSSVAVDLESVAVHEIGHVLGLGHSSVKEAVMYPTLKPRSKKIDLGIDDVTGVQSLYGTNPNFTLSGFLASETSSTNLGYGSTMIRSEGVWWLSLCIVFVFGFLDFY